MNLKNQTLHLIGSAQDQAASVAQDTMKLVHDFSVLVYVGVTATIRDSVNGIRNNA